MSEITWWITYDRETKHYRLALLSGGAETKVLGDGYRSYLEAEAAYNHYVSDPATFKGIWLTWIASEGATE